MSLSRRSIKVRFYNTRNTLPSVNNHLQQSLKNRIITSTFMSLIVSTYPTFRWNACTYMCTYIYLHIYTVLDNDAILLNILHTFSSHSLLYRILDILHSLVRAFSCYKAADSQSSSNVDEFSSTGFFYLIHCSYILRLTAVQPFETFM